MVYLLFNKSRLFVLLGVFIFNGFVIGQSLEPFQQLQKETEQLKKQNNDSTKTWKKGGVITLSGQQISLTNWSAGGQSAISTSTLIHLYASYSKGKVSWGNYLDLAYGVIKQSENKNWWKNDDRIQFTSKFGRKATHKIYYTGLLDFRSQFAKGYNYPNDSVTISDFLAPAYITSALGADLKLNENFSLFFAPITARVTLVSNQNLANAGAFGVQKAVYELDAFGQTKMIKKGVKYREEFGGYMKFQFKQTLMQNVTFETMLELFSNFLLHPENIDVNWTTLTSMKVNKYISATFSTQLIYDNDINLLRNSGEKKGTTGPAVQYKQVLGVGFTYKF